MRADWRHAPKIDKNSSWSRESLIFLALDASRTKKGCQKSMLASKNSKTSSCSVFSPGLCRSKNTPNNFCMIVCFIDFIEFCKAILFSTNLFSGNFTIFNPKISENTGRSYLCSGMIHFWKRHGVASHGLFLERRHAAGALG